MWELLSNMILFFDALQALALRKYTDVINETKVYTLLLLCALQTNNLAHCAISLAKLKLNDEKTHDDYDFYEEIAAQIFGVCV
jgi:hypothetical protein